MFFKRKEGNSIPIVWELCAANSSTAPSGIKEALLGDKGDDSPTLVWGANNLLFTGMPEVVHTYLRDSRHDLYLRMLVNVINSNRRLLKGCESLSLWLYSPQIPNPSNSGLSFHVIYDAYK